MYWRNRRRGKFANIRYSKLLKREEEDDGKEEGMCIALPPQQKRAYKVLSGVWVADAPSKPGTASRLHAHRGHMTVPLRPLVYSRLYGLTAHSRHA